MATNHYFTKTYICLKHVLYDLIRDLILSQIFQVDMMKNNIAINYTIFLTFSQLQIVYDRHVWIGDWCWISHTYQVYEIKVNLA